MSPPTIEPDESRIAGKSLIALGLVSLLSTAGLLLDWRICSHGWTGFIILLFGLDLLKTKERKRSAAMEAVGCMGVFTLESLIFVLAIIVLLGVRISRGKPITRGDLLWMLLYFVIFGAWAAINLWLCARVLRYHRHLDRNLCPACGYPVGTSNVCTECGKTKV